MLQKRAHDTLAEKYKIIALILIVFKVILSLSERFVQQSTESTTLYAILLLYLPIIAFYSFYHLMLILIKSNGLHS